MKSEHRKVLIVLAAACFIFSITQQVRAAPLPGGSLDPLSIPKYITPLVIPPVMPNDGAAGSYHIAVRQFQQAILPAGLPATTIWGYGAVNDPQTFNYPAYTIETTANTPVKVRWTNDLKDAAGNYLPHILPVDQSLHWANPGQLHCMHGSGPTDCMPDPEMNPAFTLLQPYTGPVPMITHVHGAHVDPHSDGYPEAWYLPAANNIPAGFATKGRMFDDANAAPNSNPGNLGYADFVYRNDQPATTLWYHDHTLGMTRTNVYAGPAGFWLIRGGDNDGATVGIGGPAAVLPGPAPVAGNTAAALNTVGNPTRNAIREIPLAIQDRSFNITGSLFYPGKRTFFDGFIGPYTGSSPTSTDLSPLWNPEAFFNTMVVNGKTWPVMEVAPALYRLRLLNGCNSRFLNLSLFQVINDRSKGRKQKDDAKLGAELPFYQIGAEQGFLPQVVMVQTGFATPLPGNGTIPAPVPATNPQQALLMGLAERADVMVDFRGLPAGTRIRMINTAPDAPFGGFPDLPADPSTTGQVMEFVVNAALLNAPGSTDAAATPPQNLLLKAETRLSAATGPRDPSTGAVVARLVSLNEEMSNQVCVTATPSGRLKIVDVSPTSLAESEIMEFCSATKPASLPMGPKAAKLGKVDLTNPLLPAGIALPWTDISGLGLVKTITLQSGAQLMVNVTENPALNAIEEWDLYNFTVDAHPIHLHLTRFEVVSRSAIPGAVPGPVPVGVLPWEKGFKDTVIAYPGEITRVKAKFDIAGLYVWHCHIVEHEDNEMMRPYVVGP
jgi:spore coat protein A